MKRFLLGLLALLFVALPAQAGTWSYVAPADISIVLPSGQKLAIQSAHKTWSVATDLSSNSFMLQCRVGDLWSGDAGRAVSYDRGELSYSQLKMVPGVWYKWSQTITTGGLAGGLTQSRTIFHQVHATDYPGGVPSWPVLDFEFVPGTGLSIRSSYDVAVPAAAPRQLVLYRNTHWHNGQAYRLDIEAKFDHGEGTGALRVKLDGLVIIDKANFPFGYGGKDGPYLKMGCYRITPPGAVGTGRAAFVYENVVLPTPSP